jgi:hypothetical protein
MNTNAHCLSYRSQDINLSFERKHKPWDVIILGMWVCSQLLEVYYSQRCFRRTETELGSALEEEQLRQHWLSIPWTFACDTVPGHLYMWWHPKGRDNDLADHSLFECLSHWQVLLLPGSINFNLLQSTLEVFVHPTITFLFFFSETCTDGISSVRPYLKKTQA